MTATIVPENSQRGVIARLTAIRHALDELRSEVALLSWESHLATEYRESLEAIIQAVVDLHQAMPQ
jgi:uncharacterized protein YutE (UPF0331/DUF86 family)